MEMSLQFNELNCDELLLIDGGGKAYDNSFVVGRSFGYIVTFVIVLGMATL